MADSQEKKSRRRSGSKSADKKRSHASHQGERKKSQQHERVNRARAIENAPRFEPVTELSLWCPPTKDNQTRSARVKPRDQVHRQRNRLGVCYPEALLGDPNTLSVLLDEITALGEVYELPLTSTTCHLAAGEITELYEPASVQGHPVLAFTAGQLGDTVRLVSLVKQQWTWAKNEDVVITVDVPDTQFENELAQNRGDPVSCIKFATDVERPDPIRWLIVQKASCTTIYEPELYPLDPGRGEAPATLFPNPLATVQSTHTGGGDQSDFAFRSVAGEEPQLVIVDKLGNWSLWEAGGRKEQAGPPRRLKLALQMHGNIYSESIPPLLQGTNRGGNKKKNGTLQVLFLCPKQKQRSQTKSQSLSQDGVDIADETVADESAPLPFLLISNGTNIYRSDLHTGESVAVLRSYLPEGAKVLDIVRSNLDPSEAFILTDKDLLWTSARESKSKGVRLDVLMKCEHDKDRHVTHRPGTLRLELSPVTDINGQMGCFVCIRSSRNTDVTIFWLVKSEAEEVQYHRERIHVPAPSASYIGMAMLLVDRQQQEGDEVVGLTRRLAEANARFCQILLMDKDLRVSSVLCAWTDPDPYHRDLKIGPPDVRIYAGEPREETWGHFHEDAPPVKQEYVPSPSNETNLKIRFNFSKPGGWEGLGDLEMQDGDNPWVDKLRSVFDSLPEELNSQVEWLVEDMAAQIVREEIDKSALPRWGSETGTGTAGESQLTNYNSSQFQSQSQIQSSQAFPLSSQFPPSSQFPASSQFPPSSQLLPSSQGAPNENEAGGSGDPIVNYLRQYMPIQAELAEKFSSALLGPFEWKIGGKPWDNPWLPHEKFDETVAKAIRRKERAERMRRKKDKLNAMIWGTGTTGGDDSEYASGSMAPPPSGQPSVVRASTQVPVVIQSSQALPRIRAGSSQVDTGRGTVSSSMAPVFSSQVGAGVGASQTRSQVVGGKFGDRKKKKDVKKKIGGFR
ncbi:RNA polymerase I-specific transcription-initiation factor domain containing protein [Naviculisporaceae sp. PSN 640]